MRRTALLAAFLGGCSILSLPPDGGPYGCRDDSDCGLIGLGLVCRGGWCLSPDAGLPDGGTQDAGGTVADGGEIDGGQDAGGTVADGGEIDAGRDGGADAGCTAGTFCNDGKVCTASGECRVGCSIDGGYVALNAKDQENSCLACLPASASGWSQVVDGTRCERGVCLSGSCLPACWFDGGTFAGAGPEPGDPCMACDPSRSTTAWVTSDGPLCDGGVCYGGACRQDGCFIADAGVFVDQDASFPGDICWHCDLQNPTGWTELDNYTVVDAGYCLNDAMDSIYGYHYGCLLPGQRPQAAGTHYGACLVCNPEEAVTGWSAEPDETPCTATNERGICYGGVCETSCFLTDGGALISVESDRDLYLGLPTAFRVTLRSDAGTYVYVAVSGDDGGSVFTTRAPVDAGTDGGAAEVTWVNWTPPIDGGPSPGPYSVLATATVGSVCEQAEDGFFLRSFVSPNGATLGYDHGLAISGDNHPAVFADPQPDTGSDYTAIAQVLVTFCPTSGQCTAEFGLLFRINADQSCQLLSSGWGGGSSVLFGSMPSGSWNPASGLSNSANAPALVAGHHYRLEVQATGTTLNGKVWDTAEAEPANWMVTGTAPTPDGGSGLGFYVNGGSATVRLERLTTQ